MMFIEKYTEKSFVVRGDTTPYKDILKDMGGKWNSRLTDKDNQEKFGAWLFWTSKRDEVEKWLKSLPVPEQVTERPKSSKIEKSVESNKLSDIELMLQELVIFLGPKAQDSLTQTSLYHKIFPEVIIEEDMVDDVDDKPPPKRLLG